jgi:hypothetical protein
MITALNSKNVQDLTTAVESTNAVITQYNAESVTAKRLMAPPVKPKAKASSKQPAGSK